MCFLETRDNKFQNIDRRVLHFNWCTTAFREYEQPCTAHNHFEKAGHCKVKSRELQATWLDEVVPLRVPKTIDVTKPYKLIPVTIKTGGLVKAEISYDKADDNRSYPDKVTIGPASMVKSTKQMNFWVPGPKTAALYVDWVQKNGGKIEMNKIDQMAGAVVVPKVVPKVVLQAVPK